MTPVVRVEVNPPVRCGPVPPDAGIGGAAPGQVGVGGPGPDGVRPVQPVAAAVGVPPGGGPGPGALIGLGYGRS